jgi:hypothetical protein
MVAVGRFMRGSSGGGVTQRFYSRTNFGNETVRCTAWSCEKFESFFESFDGLVAGGHSSA